VAERADHLAELLGEPLGTLILTLSIVTIEVALIAAVMLTADAAPTLGRDTMFALLMMILNGVIGLALPLGGLRGCRLSRSHCAALGDRAHPAGPHSVYARPDLIEGAGILLCAVHSSPLRRVSCRPDGSPSEFFVEPQLAGSAVNAGNHVAGTNAPSVGQVAWHTLFLILTVLPIVLLAKQLAKLIDHGIAVLGAPVALGGVLIALVVFTPEAMSALRAALDNQLQRAVNLCLGAALSTIGLTVPAVLGIGLITGQPVILGLDPAEVTLLALSLVLSTLTFSGSRTTVLEGAVHLVLFLVYVVLIFSP
jgi:Ca2+:H+ antiporter